MRNIKQMVFLISLRFHLELTNPRVLVGYLYGFWLGFIMSVSYLRFAAGNPVQILESFLLVNSHAMRVTLFVLGYFIIISDAPFVDSLTLYSLIRCGGKKWRAAMAGYLCIQSLIYGGIVVLGCALPCLFQGSFCNEWSDTMRILIEVRPDIAITEYNLPHFYEGVLAAWKPLGAVFHSFCLVGSYCLFLGIVMFVGNLNVSFPLGNLLAVGIHFLGVLLLSDFIPIYSGSMAAHSILQYHVPGTGPFSLMKSHLIFLGLDILAFGILRKISAYTDYRTSLSEKIW